MSPLMCDDRSAKPATPATRLIVNADDLGATNETNEAVFEFMGKGHITSATLMANGGAVEQAARQAQQHQQCSFGVHLNLTAFRPLTSQFELKPLLNREGCFIKGALRSTPITAQLRRALLAELSAQVEKVKALGVRVSHFDSPHHIHTIPALFGVTKQLQRRFGVRKVRISMNLYSTPQPLRLVLQKSLWNWALRHCYRTVATEMFTFLSIFVEAANRLSRHPSSVEVMVHPGAPDWKAESKMFDQLGSDQVPFPIRLISYNEL